MLVGGRCSLLATPQTEGTLILISVAHTHYIGRPISLTAYPMYTVCNRSKVLRESIVAQIHGLKPFLQKPGNLMRHIAN